MLLQKFSVIGLYILDIQKNLQFFDMFVFSAIRCSSPEALSCSDNPVWLPIQIEKNKEIQLFE